MECPWCCCRSSVFHVGNGVDNKITRPTTPMSEILGRKQEPDDATIPGTLSEHAASLLMQLLFAARVGRCDLLRKIGKLATHMTRWTRACDKELHRLMQWVHASYHYRQVGYVGDDIPDLVATLFSDADFAGSKQDMRSTSGVMMALSGPSTFWPVQMASKRQNCVSHSTPEAEMVAASFATRT